MTTKQQELKKQLENKLIVSRKRLEEMHDRLLNYVYLKTYRESIGVPLPKEILKTLQTHLPLLRNFYKVTPMDCKQVLQLLPTITAEDVLGQSLQQRLEILNTLEMRANENIQIMQSLGFQEDSDLRHSFALKEYIEDIRRKPLVPVPQVSEVNIERPVTLDIDPSYKFPDKVLRFMIKGVQGSIINGRELYLMISFNHFGKLLKIKTPLVCWVLTSVDFGRYFSIQLRLRYSTAD